MKINNITVQGASMVKPVHQCQRANVKRWLAEEEPFEAELMEAHRTVMIFFFISFIYLKKKSGLKLNLEKRIWL